VWKTTNAGATFTPVFDRQGAYSIGCVTMDPNNSNVVWVGTGENNSQRSVSFGDGVYLSRDGGKSWKNMGLKESEHIGMITIDPRDSNVVYVAAQGPLWRSGGERGLYKTTNGGKSWTRILHISDDTGINEVHMDPRDPDLLYVSSYQRRRRVWTLIHGGPESAIYKSADAGKTWRKLTRGVPSVDKGRIGLDISPADPDVIYAIIEAADGKGGFFRSSDRGESWSKRSSYMTSSPQYYNEIVCDPIEVDRVYSLNTLLQVTQDGGRTFSPAPRKSRHVDDHALWINPDNNRHLLVGCDGGIYDSYDRGQNWNYKPNLPITQFYRVSVDNSTPFYYVYGGTQDNNTLGGPSRTTNRTGIVNADWFVTVGGDGFETQVDPEDPNIVYSQWQYGGLVRHDRRSGEVVDIKPREAPGETPIRWNWDSPLIISPHNHKRLYFGGNILFRSDDQGNSWTAVSGDLSSGVDRDTLKIMGKMQSIDAVSKNRSTSIYGNTVALSESPMAEGLIYVGTDDGLIHVTEDGGKNWRKTAVFPTVPDITYVSCLTASMNDEDTVYASFDNHKNGDFKPYILKSSDRGQTWKSIAGDLPQRDVVYSVAEDHVKADLLFAGTEFGVYFTVDGGKKWIKLKSGIPTIAVKDIVIQRRENDLVLGTFGRSFYILDDYTPLRHAAKEDLSKNTIFPIKDALRYIQRSGPGGSQGASFYSAPNPAFGAVFTYYLKDKLQTRKERRKETEKKDSSKYPTVDDMRDEDAEQPPAIILIVRDESGGVVRRVSGSRSKGLHRVTWDLRYPSTNPPRIGSGASSGFRGRRGGAGPLALPGTYTVELAKVVEGKTETLVEPVSFDVIPLELATFAAKDREAVFAFQKKVARLQRAVTGASRVAGEAQTRIQYIKAAIRETLAADPALLHEAFELSDTLRKLTTRLNGDSTLRRLQAPVPLSISRRISSVVGSQWNVTSPPTQTQRNQYLHAGTEFTEVLAALRELIEKDLIGLEQKLEAAGAPWTPGRIPEWKMEDD
ncbi:MAG: glycosyl hydrolase, partial [Planctomycetes bacterium]|nr:glycosyl hydrolase [Planctomycetota bacterium]